MIELGKSSNTDFDLSSLLKWFVIIIFIWCPFYFAYHHYVVNDMFITSPGIVVEKKNHRNSSGDYVYELVVNGENGTTEKKTVNADKYIHTEINAASNTSTFNVKGMNPLMVVVGAIELFALAVGGVILFIAAGG